MSKRPLLRGLKSRLQKSQRTLLQTRANIPFSTIRQATITEYCSKLFYIYRFGEVIQIFMSCHVVSMKSTHSNKFYAVAMFPAAVDLKRCSADVMTTHDDVIHVTVAVSLLGHSWLYRVVQSHLTHFKQTYTIYRSKAN